MIRAQRLLFLLYFALRAGACTPVQPGHIDAALSAAEADSIYAEYTRNKANYASTDFNRKFPPQEVQADIKILKRLLEEAQTSIYQYHAKEEVDKAFSDALSASRDSLTYPEVVRAVSKVLHVIACGHTGWDHPDEYRRFRAANVRFLPLEIAIISGRYYIRQNNSLNEGIKNFSEITAINSIPVAQVTAELKAHTVQDGFSNPGNTLEIEQYFKMAYSNFIGSPQVFALSIRENETSPINIVNTQPLLLSQIDSIKKLRYGADKERGKPLRLNIHEDISAAVYTIEWFSNNYIQKMGQDFLSFNDSVFEQLAKREIKNLVIDLRGNRGGWTANGRDLFSYFIDTPTRYIKNIRTKKYKDFSFQPIITDLPGYDDTMQLVPEGNLYRWANNPNLWSQPATRNRFRGNVYIFMDGFTRSASSVFCSLMKTHTKAILIGRETTAAQSGTSGMVMTIQLPYSGVLISFSNARYNFNVPDSANHRGVIPQINVTPTLSDIRMHRDVYMDTALSLIKATHW